MKTEITYEDLVAMNPCYPPEAVGITEGYSATIPDFINVYRDKVKNKEDIIWVICRKDYMSNKDLRLFAVWCAREALKLVDNPDPRSVNACDVAERYARGEATDDELAAAKVAAWDDVEVAVWAAAGEAAWTAAGEAAWAAVWVAAWAAAWAAAKGVAWAAAREAARDAQIDKLLTYFE